MVRVGGESFVVFGFICFRFYFRRRVDCRVLFRFFFLTVFFYVVCVLDFRIVVVFSLYCKFCLDFILFRRSF